MNAANVRKQAHQFTRNYLDGINTIAENASAVDKAGEWGMDGWIRTIHDLFDLQVRTFAAVLQVGIAGPWWRIESPDEPLPAEPIKLKKSAITDYPRKLSALNFERVGLPDTKIPSYSLGFEPAILPPGADEFRILLKDDRFLGANYQGTVLLTPTTGGTEPDELKVIVGL